WFETSAGNQRTRSRTCARGPTCAGAATMTATALGSRPERRAPSRRRPMHQPTRLGSASWMIAPSATRPVSSRAFGPYPAIQPGGRVRHAGAEAHPFAVLRHEGEEHVRLLPQHVAVEEPAVTEAGRLGEPRERRDPSERMVGL